MRGFPTKPLAIFAVLSLASCAKSPEDLLVGTWRCNGIFRDPSTASAGTISGTVEYVRNGKSNGTVEMSMKEGGLTMIVGIVTIGSWSIDDGQLIDTAEKITPMFAEFAGQRIPGNALPQDVFNAAAAGLSTGSTIERLDDDVLIISNAGDRTSCTRIT